MRATSYSLPEHLHEHIEVVQPTTIFSRFSANKATYHSFRANTADSESDSSAITVPSASEGQVAASCNGTLTPECLLELYNATGYKPQVPGGQNRIGVTGYLEQYANYDDYHQFLEEIVPYAVDSNFSTVYINGRHDGQFRYMVTETHVFTLQAERTTKLALLQESKLILVRRNTTHPSDAAHGRRCVVDVQYAFGLTFPTQGTFYTTGGQPPYIPDALEPTNTNEPYRQASD